MKILEVLRRPRLVVALGFVLAISGVMTWRWATQVPDPVVNGRKLSEHLASIRFEGFRPIGAGIRDNVRRPFVPDFMGDEVLGSSVIAALDAAGEQSHPMLVKMLRAKASRLDIFLERNFRRATSRFPQLKRFASYPAAGDTAWTQQAKAAMALKYLGPRAQAILPKILPLVGDPDRGLAAVMAVLYLRPEREADILQLTNHFRITRLAAGATDPAFIDWNNASTLLVLATFGEKARGAAPVLIPFLSSTNEMVRGCAALALAAGKSEPQVVVPILIQSLSRALPITSSPTGIHDSSPAEMMIQALGKYGADAASAIPMLEAYARTDEFERFIAAEVLNKVMGAVETAPPTGK